MSFMPNQASRSCRLVTTNVLTRRRLSDMAAGETTVIKWICRLVMPLLCVSCDYFPPIYHWLIRVQNLDTR
ncbi:hypothetical protein I7I50_11513 [Histoplasma capsulatum G186AR]|uniref:Uncharacterized protein n=1 Tax=Ajellomyces capsulatus TaxID=5037 RepID=A0A8H7Z8C9_AJECA|nr:hypothetical protein I7I52_02750 [Histoplasma capsulatum]QSS70019.1 hypothetical protein I7I50_11513 [Histoplasma capsulatum G186AR]